MLFQDLSILALPLRENILTFCCIILPYYSPPGQKVATLPSATAARVGVKQTTGARRHLQDGTHTRRAGRKRSLGANPTSDSAAAPGAAGAHPRTRPPETGAPARPSPRTTDRTPPGESSFSVTLFFQHVGLRSSHALCCVPCREKDSPNRSDTDSRARRRSRSYSPIRKRRRDSPSFMEARRITR